MTAARTAALIVLCSLAACGKKGPPLPPLNLVPARVDDLVARRLGDDVQLQFTVPARNATGSGAADLVSVDVFAFTGPPVDARGDRLPDAEFVKSAALVASVQIAPPPDPDESEEDAAKRPPDRRPKQGEKVTATEALTAAARVPTTPLAGRVAPPVAGTVAGAGAVVTPVFVEVERPLERHYAVAGRNRHGKLGQLSARVAVPLGDVPASPPATTVAYDEAKLTVEWTDPLGARRPIQPEPRPGELPAKPLIAGPPPHTYNVYAVRAAAPEKGAGTGVLAATPLNPSPLSALRLEIAGVKFGQEQCFEVRTVEAHGAVFVESAPSPAACVTPRDTFAPAAPSNLAAVGAEGAINLIWEASGAADLAGYLVLRAEGGGPLQVITPAPIRETTFRDTDVKAGARYVYAIVAVDTAVPPNRSPESNPVEETAR